MTRGICGNMGFRPMPGDFKPMECRPHHMGRPSFGCYSGGWGGGFVPMCRDNSVNVNINIGTSGCSSPMYGMGYSYATPMYTTGYLGGLPAPSKSAAKTTGIISNVTSGVLGLGLAASSIANIIGWSKA